MFNHHILPDFAATILLFLAEIDELLSKTLITNLAPLDNDRGIISCQCGVLQGRNMKNWKKLLKMLSN